VQQKCLAHLIRAATELEQQKTRGAVRFPRAVARLFRDALALAGERPALEAEDFERRRAEIEARLDRLIGERRHFTDPHNARLAKRLRKQRRHLLTFLGDAHPELEATNNRAERMLRPGVITRKTGGCNRSRTGARTHEVLASVLVSLRQQGRDVLGYLSAALLAPGLPPPLSSAPAPAIS
jgi:transposase